MFNPCPPPPTKTHTDAQCVSVPLEGIQAERVMGGYRLWGDVNGLGVCVCVCVCVYWGEGGRGSISVRKEGTLRTITCQQLIHDQLAFRL